MTTQTEQPILTGTDKKLITGYVWGELGQFIGSYNFHNNEDKDELHLPPNTTLIAPPIIPVNKQAFWDKETTTWVIKDKIPLTIHPNIHPNGPKYIISGSKEEQELIDKLNSK